MAERKNFLDREKEKQNGDSVLPYSVALIPGLTALEQDALVKDVAEGLVKNNVNALHKRYDGEGTYDEIKDAVRSRNIADKLERGIQRLPEPLRDSWLMSIMDGNSPYFYGEKIMSEKNLSDGTTGFYDNDKSRPYINKETFFKDPFTAIHENAHKMNHDLNLSHPFYENVDRKLVPDRMSGIGLGKILSDEFPKVFETSKGLMDRKEFIDKIGDILESGDKNAERKAKEFYYDTIRRNYLAMGPKLSREDYFDFLLRYETILDDIINLSPDFEGGKNPNNLVGKVTQGHDRKYAEKVANHAVAQKSALDVNGLGGRDFTDFDAMRYAGLSAETSAELAEFMAARGGKEYVKYKYPNTYERMMEEYRNDPRRSWPKETLRPWQLYSKESPSNVYEYRGEPVAYDKNAERHYLRVPDPYGGWHYGDDYTDVNLVAARRGKNYVEYRDLDGNWKRFYPNELKYVKEGKINRNKKWALELVKKLRNGVK